MRCVESPGEEIENEKRVTNVVNEEGVSHRKLGRGKCKEKTKKQSCCDESASVCPYAYCAALRGKRSLQSLTSSRCGDGDGLRERRKTCMQNVNISEL